MMKCNDFVSQHAVNLFLDPLRSVRICDDSVRIRTGTTLDQLCRYVQRADRVIVDNMSEFFKKKKNKKMYILFTRCEMY